MDFVLNVSAKATLDIMTISGARVARLFRGVMSDEYMSDELKKAKLVH